MRLARESVARKFLRDMGRSFAGMCLVLGVMAGSVRLLDASSKRARSQASPRAEKVPSFEVSPPEGTAKAPSL